MCGLWVIQVQATSQAFYLHRFHLIFLSLLGIMQQDRASGFWQVHQCPQCFPALVLPPSPDIGRCQLPFILQEL